MSKGIQITKDTNLKFSNPEDFTINTLFPGSFKVHELLTFKLGGELTTMSATFGLSAYIQKYNHNLGYVPAYLAYVIYGTPNSPGGFAVTPYNDFISVAGNSDFVNVDANKVTVGFDSFLTADRYMKVILFAEKLADS